MNREGLLLEQSSGDHNAAWRLASLPPYLTVGQVGALTTLGRSSIYNRMNDVEDPLPRPVRVGRRVMWRTVEVMRYMDRHARLQRRHLASMG